MAPWRLLALCAGARAVPLELSGEAFYEAVGRSPDTAWLVLFHAPWCGACRALLPEWEALAGSWAGPARLATVDAVAEPSLAERHGVSGYPTLIDVRGGLALFYDGVRYQ